MAESKMSPMMQQYLDTKKQYPDCILMYRIGDFYEMFYDDAKTASEELELVLTGKECGLPERAPMCGVPFHAVDVYISKLVKKGYKVAIGEQVEDPKLAKGLVKREVIRVVTPGTVLGTGMLEESKNNFLMCVAYLSGSFGISSVDVSTGDFFVTEAKDIKGLMDEISHYQPSEIICNSEFLISGISEEELKGRFGVRPDPLSPDHFNEEKCRQLLTDHFHCDLKGLGIADLPAGILSAGAILAYIYETQFSSVSYINALKVRSSSSFMILDSTAMRNLELLETLREKEKKGSLLWVLDKTKTAMGGRTMRRIISEPLVDREEIIKRQDAVQELCDRFIDREEICEYLKPVYDIERLLSLVSNKRANALDLHAIRQSLSMLPYIRQLLSGFESEALCEICENIPEISDLFDLLTASLTDEPPVSVRDGGMIREGYSEEADHLRNAGKEGKEWLLQLEAEEREKTGIRQLKIKYNKVFGYCIEVSNSLIKDVPDYFIRKQTLTTGERYTTEKLEELADTILGAQDKLKNLEYDLFCGIRDTVAERSSDLRQLSQALGYLDVLCSLSAVAMRNNYVRPNISENGVIRIKDGRHPVVELMSRDGTFVPNDTYLDNKDHLISIITGPNMAGKSTYMRQTALIVLMAQTGSFVPASSADICVCDRIFTRVGASDDLASGQSTFMVEMNEVANILRNATAKSLLILDEIGRGTSTYDGLSIAWSVVEYISDKKKIGAKTLFATHYHELTELEGKIRGVQNYCIAVKEKEGDLVFLRKIIPGGADKSYGIAVAKLAGVPEEVTDRAEQIAERLEANDINRSLEVPEPETGPVMQEAKAPSEVVRTLQETDVTKLTPIEALLLIDELKKKI
ncbi:MAG: DNA mismatch repair protein MutS [Lachnospiraceae bacterium]|nr:DNA mismatch repair protein MutS [Lachnospiraceae bacterium]